MDVARRCLGFDQQARQGFFGRWRAGPVETGEGLVAAVERAVEPLLAVFVWLVLGDEVGELARANRRCFRRRSARGNTGCP